MVPKALKSDVSLSFMGLCQHFVTPVSHSPLQEQAVQDDRPCRRGLLQGEGDAQAGGHQVNLHHHKDRQTVYV